MVCQGILAQKLKIFGFHVENKKSIFALLRGRPMRINAA